MNRKTIIASLLLLMVIGCASWQKTSAVSYKSIGIALRHTNQIALNLIEQGVVSDLDRVKLKEQFVRANESYVKAGAALDKIIDFGDMADGIVSDKYLELIGNVNNILNDINIILDKYLKED